MSGGVEWALHCCVVLSGAERPVPAQRLAQLHDVSPTYLAKQLQALSRAGIVRSSQGAAGGYALVRDPGEVTVLDVVEAVDGAGPAFVCTEVRQCGPFPAPPRDCARACPIARAMHDAERAWRASLRSVTIADLAGTVADEVPPERLGAALQWLRGPAG
ncbi:RrF2 family transcriptional regulator [Vallicoccus soli]|uniref:Rrf2 family transcriptional regulator n=1 Tax=Vallicoccus soli TaxID=2339232 RepID=A0A3A3Z8S2_9ACTN|nr:Rrf2 family transcriptional regulator [Vallicoccus soli]RJK98307.1 Rrf2 family transcriptional regulator [Vallicoccus soli]